MGDDVTLRTSDGVELAADLAVAADAWAGAVVCHPHPAYGGDRHNAVVDRIFRTLAGAGVTTLRFDFRRTGDGDGEGGEGLDVAAAVDQVAAHLGPGAPLWLVGYSFGADVALAVDHDRVAGWVAVAPPLRFGGRPAPATGDGRPVLIVAAAHDRVSPPDRLRDASATWPDAALTVVPSADHFLLGATDRVADHVLTWLRAKAGRA